MSCAAHRQHRRASHQINNQTHFWPEVPCLWLPSHLALKYCWVLWHMQRAHQAHVQRQAGKGQAKDQMAALKATISESTPTRKARLGTSGRCGSADTTCQKGNTQEPTSDTNVSKSHAYNLLQAQQICRRHASCTPEGKYYGLHPAMIDASAT